ncbi:RNA dependent RNA polymerase-domain-containing protein [Mycena filopes]|nr:RNA dependent RNA polymerase-domain-containing protein [Mycena filopes]
MTSLPSSSSSQMDVIEILDSESESDSELWSSMNTPASSSSHPSSSSSYPSSSSQVQISTQPTRPLKRKLDYFDDSPIPLAKKLKQAHEVIDFTTSVSRLQDTRPHLIAGFQSPIDQETFMSTAELPTGVVWELARLVSTGKLTTTRPDDLEKLIGSNHDAAPRTVETLLHEKTQEAGLDAALAAERRAQSPWGELDLEETAMRLDPNAALGNCSENLKSYYGGKICFSGNIEIDTTKMVKVVLDRCTLTSSCRLYRRFGSSSFLRLKVPLRTLHSPENGLREFFRKPFIVFNSVFRAFYAKDGAVFLFKTRETYYDNAVHDSEVGLSLFEFLDEFNPLEHNANQLLCKWASRFALGLSNSVPGPIIDPENVEEIDDIFSPAKSNMTDGCGMSNAAFNLKLRFDFNLPTTPCAVQVRHGGRKGMLLMSPELTQDQTPRVAFRKPSQVKITYSEEAKAHPANATMDILRFSRTTCPARISPEVIVNLEHNGVPADVFIAMQDAYLAQGVDDMLFWAKEPGREEPQFMYKLWVAVEKSEGVLIARRMREAEGEARFRGYGEGFKDAVQDEEEEEDAVQQRSTAWWPDYISGCPSSLAETIMTLIDSGFTPQSLPVLRDKLKQVVLAKIKYRATHFRYEVAQSASAFVVPDFWQVLEENQIHFKSSRREFQNDDGLETDTILGEVLMTRNPCKVPTDVRKVTAVKHNQLHDIVDVIVCSVKGQRRLLDFLAGGDYDGDRALVIWDKTIVNPFTNAPERFADEPAGANWGFTRDETTVAKFNADYARAAPEVKAAALQKYLLGSLRDPSAVGQYSTYHDNAIVKRGYDNPHTVKLAYQFCKILDSPKTGYNLRPEAREAAARDHGHARGPAWKKKVVNGSAINSGYLERKVDPQNPKLCRRFIMDILNDAATNQKDRWLVEAEGLFHPFETGTVVPDPHLTKPWLDFAAFAVRRIYEKDNKPQADLILIGKHVARMYEHAKTIKATARSQSQAHAFTEQAIETRQDTLRELSRDFAAAPSLNQMSSIFDPVCIARLRASYAYIYDHEKSMRGWSRFPWDVALGDLCRIKAAALGPHKAVTMGFYERFKLGGERRK